MIVLSAPRSSSLRLTPQQSTRVRLATVSTVRWLAMGLLLFLPMNGGCGRIPQPIDDGSTPPAQDVQLLIQQLRETGPGNAGIRNVAAMRLGRLGADAAEALPILEELTKKDPSPAVRKTAAKSVKLIRGK